jgi:hypothetical protein
MGPKEFNFYLNEGADYYWAGYNKVTNHSEMFKFDDLTISSYHGLIKDTVSSKEFKAFVPTTDKAPRKTVSYYTVKPDESNTEAIYFWENKYLEEFDP